jgi:hypothetical protein
MLNRSCATVLFALLWSCNLPGQEASYGISVPITISGDGLYEHGAPAHDGQESSFTGGARAVVSPTLRLGAHWFLYSAIEVYSSSYFAYDRPGGEGPPVGADALQAFVGYTAKAGELSLLIKGGQLSSAFGLFPVEYDDAKTPFVNPPAMYISNLPLRADQLACGVADLVFQPYGGEVEYNCGGSRSDSYGLVPVTLYGLPAIESDLSWRRVDARLQITNSSPVNPQGFASGSQAAQWTAGGGYTLPAGLHLGVSGFRGPYLDRDLMPLLPVGRTMRDFPASGVGVDAEWSHGPWSTEGEWQHFRFDLPGFVISPSENAAYAQLKRILSPRAFVAARVTAQRFGRIQDASGAAAKQYQAPQYLDELTLGYRLNRQQLLKLGFNWTNFSSWAADYWAWPASHGYGMQLQLVTSFTAVSKAFR